MRRRARIDANQPEIVKALRDMGATVQSLAAVGKGCPDLLVGYKGHCFVFEVKDGSKPASETRLTPLEQTWAANWKGQYGVLFDVRAAKDFMNALTRERV